MCRVGDVFHLATSTFEWFPGVALHRSHDLVHWTTIGHALDRPAQLDLRGTRPSGGVFAPTLRHDGHRFVLVTTVVGSPRRSGHLLVTAEDPAGDWSDPLWLEGAPGFDPSLLFDDDGRCWFTATHEPDPVGAPGRTEVYVQELDVDTGVFRGDRTVIWRGSVPDARWAEGPHLYRVDGRVVLVAAEGGTEVDHAVVSARAAAPTGPFVARPEGPVLTHRDLGPLAPLRHVGHADLVTTPDGRWWAVLLAVRDDGRGGSLTGRETALVPVRWDADGWPRPGVDGRVPASLPAASFLLHRCLMHRFLLHRCLLHRSLRPSPGSSTAPPRRRGGGPRGRTWC